MTADELMTLKQSEALSMKNTPGLNRFEPITCCLQRAKRSQDVVILLSEDEKLFASLMSGNS